MTEQQKTTGTVAPDSKSGKPSTAVLGPFTARDVTVFGAVVVMFVASLIPLIFTFGLTGNLWNVQPLFYVGVGVILPVLVGVMFLVRRLNPAVKMHAGSLSVDQFASVTASFAVAFFFLAVVSNFALGYLVGLIGALAMLSATVLASMLPFFAGDFVNRPEAPAHVMARDAVAAATRPAKPKPAVAAKPGAVSAPATGQVAATAGSADATAAGQPAAQIPGQHFASQTSTFGAVAATPAATTPAAGAAAAETPAAPTPTAETAGSAAENAAADAEPARDDDSSPLDAAGGHAEDVPGDKLKFAVDSHGGAVLDETAPAESVAGDTASAGTGEAVAPATTAGAGDVAAATPDVVVPAKDAAVDAAASATATTLNPKIAEPAPEPQVDSITATVDPAARKVEAEPAQEPFWFAVARPQNVVDEHTRQFLYKLTPGNWILALADRGTNFLVQNSDGKVGVLLDLDGIERAPESN